MFVSLPEFTRTLTSSQVHGHHEPWLWGSHWVMMIHLYNRIRHPVIIGLDEGSHTLCSPPLEEKLGFLPGIIPTQYFLILTNSASKINNLLFTNHSVLLRYKRCSNTPIVYKSFIIASQIVYENKLDEMYKLLGRDSLPKLSYEEIENSGDLQSVSLT